MRAEFLVGKAPKTRHFEDLRFSKGMKWKRKKLWNGAHQEEENEVDLNLPGRKGLEDWWEKRD